MIGVPNLRLVIDVGDWEHCHARIVDGAFYQQRRGAARRGLCLGGPRA
jgi:hypothetical protein